MSLNVLVVDDSAVMRLMLIKTMRLSGVPLGVVREAANGVEALEVLEDEWIDLALVDINMPVMNGEELIHHMEAREDMRAVRVLVVSTESSTARLQRLEGRIDGFVHKPFTPEDFRDVVLEITGVEPVAPSGGCTPAGHDLDF